MVEFKGLGARRAQRAVVERIARETDLDTSQVLTLPSDRPIDDFDPEELDQMVRPEGVGAVLLGQIRWISGTVQRGRLKLILWTKQGKAADLTIDVAEGGRITPGLRDALANSFAPIVQSAITPREREPEQQPEEAKKEGREWAPPGEPEPREATEARVDQLFKQQEETNSVLGQLRLKLEEGADLFVSGAARIEFYWATDATPKSYRFGQGAFNLFYLALGGSYNRISIEAQYRFYGSGIQTLWAAWVGYQAADFLELRLGVLTVPFGLFPRWSHNVRVSPGFYYGLELDRDLGLGLVFNTGNFQLNFAYFMSPEYGRSTRMSRDSADVIRADLDDDGIMEYDNEERHQFNLRLAQTFDHGDGTTEIGISGEYGFLLNHTTEQNGFRWKAAAHAHGTYGPVELRALAGRYEYRPKNPAGGNNDVVLMAMFDTPLLTAARSYFVAANGAITLDVQKEPLSFITFYVDYGLILQDGLGRTERITPGILVNMGKLLVYLDVFVSKNHAFLGGAPDAHAGGGDDEWKIRTNLNVGYYF